MMRDLRRAIQVVGVLALSLFNPVRGKSQLVMEESFFMATSICEGVSCRKQIVGANETFGIAAHRTCTRGETYGILAKPPTKNLFELVYSCRKDGKERHEIESKEACGIASVCLDASTTPELSEITYQIAFEFATDPCVTYDVIVDVKLYFNFMEVNKIFYDLKSSVPVRCQLVESCHRNCIAGEKVFTAILEDRMGDGWNAGDINVFDTFHLDRREVLDYPRSDENRFDGTALDEADGASYTNTLPGGHGRFIPICMADGEYLISVDSHATSMTSNTVGDEHHLPCDTQWIESSWHLCGHSGTLFDSAFLRVQDGTCTVIESWGLTPQPSITPGVGGETTQAPSIPGGGTGCETTQPSVSPSVGVKTTQAPSIPGERAGCETGETPQPSVSPSVGVETTKAPSIPGERAESETPQPSVSPSGGVETTKGPSIPGGSAESETPQPSVSPSGGVETTKAPSIPGERAESETPQPSVSPSGGVETTKAPSIPGGSAESETPQPSVSPSGGVETTKAPSIPAGSAESETPQPSVSPSGGVETTKAPSIPGGSAESETPQPSNTPVPSVETTPAPSILGSAGSKAPSATPVPWFEMTPAPSILGSAGSKAPSATPVPWFEMTPAPSILGSAGSETSQPSATPVPWFEMTPTPSILGSAGSETSQPSVTPVPWFEMTQAPSISTEADIDTGSDIDDYTTLVLADDDGLNDFDSEVKKSLKHRRIILAIICALAVVGAAAVCGTYANNHYFGGNEANATCAGEGDSTSLPHSNVDEFAP